MELGLSSQTGAMRSDGHPSASGFPPAVTPELSVLSPGRELPEQGTLCLALPAQVQMPALLSQWDFYMHAGATAYLILHRYIRSTSTSNLQSPMLSCFLPSLAGGEKQRTHVCYCSLASLCTPKPHRAKSTQSQKKEYIQAPFCLSLLSLKWEIKKQSHTK